MRVINRKNQMKTIKSNWGKLAAALCAGLALIILSATGLLWGQTAPVMTIAPTGTNQFSIVITNGVTNVNYELFWTPSLNDPAFPWTLAVEGAQGQTNFTVDGGVSPIAFFRANLGSDFDGDGVPNWMDANPYDPTVGALTVIINSPTNGAVVQ
jgi:hypothetical protein